MAAIENQRDVRSHNEALIARMKPGDLIEFPRGLYSHWAVYIGDAWVVHLKGDTLSGDTYNKAVIKVDNFWDVVDRSKAKINNSKDGKYSPLPESMIVRNALANVGREGYSVLLHNCEHFATWCRYKHKESEQVDNVMTGLGILGIGLALGILFDSDKPKKKA